MTKKPLFACETLFPRIAAIIHEADGHIAYYEIVEKLAHDPVVRSYATETVTPSHIASRAMGLFSQHYTMKRTNFGMESYRREFVRKRDGDVWAYKAKEGYMPTAEYAKLLPVVEEIKDLLTELANAKDEPVQMRLHKELRRRGFTISKARDYLKGKRS
jgi:hypothetical protein